MKPYTRSIIGLFDGKRRYLIPLYQRQYSWRNDPQLGLLWEDIERAVARIETDRSSLIPHFMGAIVINQVKTYGAQVQAFEVIDGQQRLTTFQLLLAALRDVAAEHGSPYAQEIAKYLLNDGVMERPDEERYKLWPSITDRRAFVHLIDPAADLSGIAGLAEGDELVGKLATTAHGSFRNRIIRHLTVNGAFDETRLQVLFEALKDGLAVVSIELEGGDDPQTIFETLNSRGVPLSPADLLRNFIFQRAKGLGQSAGSLTIDKLYEKHWLPLDRAFWTQQASRGRQTRTRLDWMLTDHLAMHVGDIVSIEGLFADYRKWILNRSPFATVAEELESISATAAVEHRLFAPRDGDPVGRFGQMADAFDVSTAMPLAIYLATETSVAARLAEAFAVLESYILRRDICGLTTKNYNRFFVGLVTRLRDCEGDKVDELIAYLSSRTADLDRWPDDAEWRHSWIMREQYKSARQPRLRYIFEAIERAKRTSLNEDIVIRSALTIEHIMPQKWQASWPIPEMIGLTEDQYGPELVSQIRARETAVNAIGNLTLLTQALNATISNGPLLDKLAAIKTNTALALNREIMAYETWSEASIEERGAALFDVAAKLWAAPQRAEIPGLGEGASWTVLPTPFPTNGTPCRFTYMGKDYIGMVVDGALVIDGVDGQYYSFSAASRAVTSTHRNGWNDWYIGTSEGGWMPAAEWRLLPSTVG
ncbi:MULTISPECIES: DUF262 domain-containing protein [unclassified Novosphingobium]|uniref:DUF262 domain-containing protein n=1 Tax=unclassified Novosphingobium TaxID=2644732 RepID=UPI0014943BF9|nr:MULTISPECIES: DUF262 domain-containing protein [unclassified Novosphingobium]MBB3358833.1 hypothetical protein [Novosphingobium sp. BK256]MBB3375194.1 hypothetical protein [Novosphingobium sp. BK280]MBB3379118.1 hypothetical protein [Novosphingobium sp. BK258]MBB3420812.1 hypothetical protein [Novosphingobium sp. BK267]MBB3449615.1 hypothetical protein [Novosphingobium sp. BK352]